MYLHVFIQIKAIEQYLKVALIILCKVLQLHVLGLWLKH